MHLIKTFYNTYLLMQGEFGNFIDIRIDTFLLLIKSTIANGIDSRYFVNNTTIWIITKTLYIQVYPQRMRLQRRLYKINTLFFFLFKNPGLCESVSLSVHSLKRLKKDDSFDRIFKLTLETSNKRVLGRLYSLILCG